MKSKLIGGIVAALLVASVVWAADTILTNYPAVVTPALTDTMWAVQGGVDKKLTAGQILGSGADIDSSGNVTITESDISDLAHTGLDDTPVDAQTAEGITSNWAFDHNTAHTSNYDELQMIVFDFTTDTATGDGGFYFHIGPENHQRNLTYIHGRVITAGTTGTTDIEVYNVTEAADMLSTGLTIDSGETGSDTAATPPVIDLVDDFVEENDVIRVDVDAVSTTPAKGLIVTLGFTDN